ncbi:MAG: hypothetical protein JEZ08_20665 [Clostridiales bacterium]|nr:hypothetical protein [Clostridiales bacterium]
MKKIIDKMILEMEKIIDKMVPKSEEVIDKMILSKISDKGLRITYWISSVLSKVFLIFFLFGVIHNLYVFGMNTYYWKSYDIVPYNWFTTLILSFILPMFIDLTPYIAMRLIEKLIRAKLKYEIDHRSVLFATGLYFIIFNIKGVIGIIESVAHLVYQMQWNTESTLLMFLNPFINTLTTIIYILIGLNYMKMSNCLKDKITPEQI